MYSVWSQKNFVVMQLSASLAACPFVSSSTSHVVKLCRQKYCSWMLAVRISSSNVSFKSSSLDVRDKEWESVGIVSFGYFGDGQDKIALQIWGMLANPIPIILLRAFLTDFSGSRYCIFHRPLSWLYRTARSSCFWGFSWRSDRKDWSISAFVIGYSFFRLSWEGFLGVLRCFCLPSEGSGNAPKRIWELFGESIRGASTMVARGNQKGRVRCLCYSKET